ncbi:MAG TPA: M48 family metalloprotease, partial [Actinomycetota bacterium]|nr:M48 family metalloprotease [Actinomycetota bacterium]
RLLRGIRRVVRWLAQIFHRLSDRTGGVAGSRAVDGALGMAVLLVVLGVLVLAGSVLVVALGLLWLPLALLVRLAKVLAAALSRAGEHAADRHAAELGYGAGLVQVLLLFLQAEQSAPRLRGMAALLRSHPSSRSRIDAINQTLHQRVSKIYR